MTFHTIYSAEDSAWVGLCAQYPSLSWLAPTRAEALEGIRRLVAEECVIIEHREA